MSVFICIVGRPVPPRVVEVMARGLSIYNDECYMSRICKTNGDYLSVMGSIQWIMQVSVVWVPVFVLDVKYSGRGCLFARNYAFFIV